MHKQFISHHSLYIDSYRLGKKILESGCRPDFIMALWRGGCTTGMVIQEYLEYQGISTHHTAVYTSAYPTSQKLGEASPTVEVEGLEYPQKHLTPTSKLLIVDDVFDTGRTIETVVRKLTDTTYSKDSILLENIQVATVYYKPSKNQTPLKPHFYVHATENWLVFPHELQGLSLEEIKENKDPEIQSFF